MKKDYTSHYKLAQDEYRRDNQNHSRSASIDDINVTLVNPHRKSPKFNLPANYMQLVNEISDQINSKLSDDRFCFFPPDRPREKDVVIRLKESEQFKINGVEELAKSILPQLEEKFFNSYLMVDHLYFYRNIITDAPPLTSWLWHYDNHPKEIHKIMIYLSDVTEDSGPFEYLKDQNGKPVIISPSRTGVNNWSSPKWPRSRVPSDVLEDFLSRGYKPCKVTGPKGTMLIFDNNCIHKANIGKSGHRDVMVFQIRPSLKKFDHYIDPLWTGGFETNDIHKDPFETKPYCKWKKK